MTTQPRIVSLVPSVTEILFELGVGDQVVGVSHQCRYPPEARQRPALTRDRIPWETVTGAGKGVLLDGSPSSAAIDEAYTQFLAKEGSPYTLDTQLLSDLQPDVIFDQGICEVCAIGPQAVDEAVHSAGVAVALRVPEVITISAATLDQILKSIGTIGAAARVPEVAAALIASLQQRIEAVRATAAATERPRTFCLEWLDPIWCAGHWVPEMVEIAGGRDWLGRPGAPSVRVDWEEVVAERPEALVLMPCSFSIKRALRELSALTSRRWWSDLPAVRDGRVWVVDSGCFSHHSHRTIEGLEMLAHVLHPELFPNRWAADRLCRVADLPPAS